MAVSHTFFSVYNASGAAPLNTVSLAVIEVSEKLQLSVIYRDLDLCT
jgi:hypothetical protein